MNLYKVESFFEQALGWNQTFAVAIAVGSEGEEGQELYMRVLKLATLIRSRYHIHSQSITPHISDITYIYGGGL